MSKSEREAELWERDGEAAKRGLEWLDMLIKLRRAAERGVPPDALVEVLRGASLDAMYHDYVQLTKVLYARFTLGRAELQFSDAQSYRGGLGAAARWADRAEVGNIIDRLARRVDELGDRLPVADLWPNFYSELDDAQLHPQEKRGEHGQDSNRMIWSANPEGMTFKTFENRVSEARRKL